MGVRQVHKGLYLAASILGDRKFAKQAKLDTTEIWQVKSHDRTAELFLKTETLCQPSITPFEYMTDSTGLALHYA
jgi:hypothetical protein